MSSSLQKARCALITRQGTLHETRHNNKTTWNIYKGSKNSSFFIMYFSCHKREIRNKPWTKKDLHFASDFSTATLEASSLQSASSVSQGKVHLCWLEFLCDVTMIKVCNVWKSRLVVGGWEQQGWGRAIQARHGDCDIPIKQGGELWTQKTYRCINIKKTTTVIHSRS